jgi:hypothetical protein
VAKMRVTYTYTPLILDSRKNFVTQKSCYCGWTVLIIQMTQKSPTFVYIDQNLHLWKPTSGNSVMRGIAVHTNLDLYFLIHHITPCYRDCLKAWQLEGSKFKSTLSHKLSMCCDNLKNAIYHVLLLYIQAKNLSPHYLV